MQMEPEANFLQRPLSRKAAVLVFSALMLPVIVFFVFAVKIWEADALAQSRDRDVALDQARIEAGYPAVLYRQGWLLQEATARRVVARHFADESRRLTAEGGAEVVTMTVEEITSFCAEATDAGELRGTLLVAVASLLDDGPVRSEHRSFVASIKGSRVVEVSFDG